MRAYERRDKNEKEINNRFNYRVLVSEISPNGVFINDETNFRRADDYTFYVYYFRPHFAGGYDTHRYIIKNQR